jgi:NAD-dependent dihydropyrimidine dehydrogenase PreA subunit
MPIVIDANICRDGCTICDYFCPGDIIYRDHPKETPVVKYQDECWYCGICADNCPTDAITVVFPEYMVNCQTDVRTLMGLPAENASGD